MTLADIVPAMSFANRGADTQLVRPVRRGDVKPGGHEVPTTRTRGGQSADTSIVMSGSGDTGECRP